MKKLAFITSLGICLTMTYISCTVNDVVILLTIKMAVAFGLLTIITGVDLVSKPTK